MAARNDVLPAAGTPTPSPPPGFDPGGPPCKPLYCGRFRARPDGAPVVASPPVGRLVSTLVDPSPVIGRWTSTPAPLPLGVRFADRVTIREIPWRTADLIYTHHHSYLPQDRTPGSLAHHGIYFDGHIVGAITWGAHPTEHDLHGYAPAERAEVARVCLGIDMPNLASCAMAKSQTMFMDAVGRERGTGLLVTYVREDYAGSMFAALAGRGWERDGIRNGSAPSNRPTRDIHSYGKERWICEVDRS